MNRLRPRDRVGRDDGFTLIELVVAMMIITMVLVSLMMVQVSALVTTAQTRQRSLGTAVANQVMEELRALPHLVLSRGLHTSFQSAGPDANVSAGRLRPPSSPAINEALVLTSSQVTDAPPLSGPGGSNVTRQTDPSIPGVEFVSRAYVSDNPATADGVLTLTVVTSWTANRTGTPRSVLLRSEAYAPQGGCGDNANMPFLGACQALFSASGGSVGPVTSLTPAAFDPVGGGVAPGELLPGAVHSSGTVTAAGTGVGVTSQQTTSTESSVAMPTSSFAPPDAAVPQVTSGGAKLHNGASDDVGASGAAPSNPPAQSAVGTASPITISGGGVTLRLTAGSGVSGAARSSMVASCASGIPAGQGCSGATVTGGTATSAGMEVAGQAFTLADVGAGASSSFGARLTTAAGATGIGCTVLDGAGCVAAGSSRSIPTAVFGAAPWAGGAAPTGLVRLTSAYTDSVLVQRGKLQPVTTATRARSAVLAYWNGTGYSSVNVNATTSATYVGGTTTWTGGGWTVTATPTVTITPAMSMTDNLDPVACTGEGCSISADAGSVNVAVRWTATDGAAQVAFVATTSLGTSQADAAYRAAPDA
ncbi:type II secretion system protein [Cellulomonas xiejunii]|uniref:Type II secretion system GspH family protein n=1 Tax=Cellulomonas xiejunii TaxID=2968083 RepID=A0ABY5KT02_9CELL|nr:type II secretion system protein [Cellulomonas xiejunii]MCC2314815.1 type II secretion system GspH family protein [Cellulomonas xiejunii]MCC2323097.1 type II secretion system GspH family protein [Cellulomonas xiejunii]UUI73587.1 type II secretion system GspH family protein [Cellulomonas xiejunii]